MALLKCPECGAEISSDARACPQCGKPQKKPTNGCLVVVLAGLIIILFLGMLEGFEPSAPANDNRKVATPSVEIPPKNSWTYSQERDEMGKGTIYFAWTKSTNAVELESPYGGPQRGTLQIRTHPRWGKDVMFRIDRGQIMCHSNDCNVLVRFDDQEARRYSAGEPDDNSSEVVFIHDYDTFVPPMLKAKRVRISVNFYQNGNQVFDFDVSGFEQSKYKPNTKSPNTPASPSSPP